MLLAILVAVNWGPLHRLDESIALDLNDYVAPHHDQARVWRAVSAVLSPAVLRGSLLIVAATLLVYRRLRAGLLCAGVALGSLLIVSSAKAVVDRARPQVAEPVAHAPGASFPSGHALTSAAVCIAVVVIAWRGGSRWRRIAVVAGAVLVAGAVGFSRMILGVHFLTDVVGGWLGAAALVLGLLALVSDERLTPR